MDGIDVAVADLRLTGDEIELIPLGSGGYDYPAELRADLVAAMPPADCSARRLCELDTGIGQAFGRAASNALDAFGDGRADLVGSLGQTIYHWVSGEHCLGTLQLGQPAWIAEATGLPVVADLRTRDVAAGGHGAPLASTLDALWLGGLAASTGRPVLGLNIGGIANVTVVTDGGRPLAFDTGPGNALLDAAAVRISGGTLRQDTGGAIAASGRVRPDLLTALLADPYYAAPAPRSTGKEHFNADYLRRVLGTIADVTAPDLLATLVELTARTIADACRRHLVPGATVVASGGGLRNPTLTAALAAAIAPADLVDSAALGLPGDGKEAYLAALLGFLTWQGVPANAPAATGAAGPRLLGSITPGRGPLRLPEPATSTVTRLRVLEPETTPAAGGASARR
ncbi:anhydro-N-acetylmuramic acid kinase [Solihabitans fulvus]|uniref:Anhydro-N-acetylmuramic acid kinase n=1 Tax=Solihabitans fulvus TaxID=1892852 RepID=A0A5B2WSH7_9PSEU|nr:anhydro-N-acetylmuramic acid kinase [Solihabitans fulvus]KAA2253652.1 anhydro-N-acetylmuramic acid kinase [Solihabitans fulvus]